MAESLNPGKIFDTLNAHQQSAALRGAIELQVFHHIAAGSTTALSLARECKANARAMRILCDYLVVQEFLTKNGDEYGLTPMSAVFLDTRSPAYLGGIARFINSQDLLDAFQDVAQLVRRGTTMLEQKGTVSDDYAGWVEFARCMVPMMQPAAEFIGSLAARLAPGKIRVLDVAAGHGMFGIAIAKSNPQASVVALDWEKVLEVADENAKAAKVAERYEWLPGDALSIDFGRGFDMVLLTNFLHHFDRSTCELILRKAYDCLNELGHVIVLEFVPDEDRVSPPTAATFALMMLASTPAGDAYTFSEYSSMGKACGFANCELLDLPNSPQRIIVMKK